MDISGGISSTLLEIFNYISVQHVLLKQILKQRLSNMCHFTKILRNLNCTIANTVLLGQAIKRTSTDIIKFTRIKMRFQHSNAQNVLIQRNENQTSPNICWYMVIYVKLKRLVVLSALTRQIGNLILTDIRLCIKIQMILKHSHARFVLIYQKVNQISIFIC